jgi:hypothetical protein
MRALSVVNYKSAMVLCSLRLACQAATSVTSAAFVGNATIETLRQKDADFGLGHLEPASMFWRLMPFEPLHEVSRFGGTRGFDCALT